MGFALTCDSCGSEITPSSHGRVTLPGDGTEAGPEVDLCRACSAGVAKEAKVKVAVAKFRERRAAAAAAVTAAPAAPAAAGPPPAPGP